MAGGRARKRRLPSQGMSAVGLLMVSVGVPGSWHRRALVVAATVGVLVGVTGFTPVSPQAPSVVPVPEAPDSASDEELTAPDSFAASANARVTGERVEDLSQRTEVQSVYAMPDGTWQAASSTGPVWVRRGGDGTAPEDWAPADATLGGAPGGRLAPLAHVADLTVSGGEAAGEDGVSVVAGVSDPETGVLSELTWPGDLPEPEVAGPRATYRQVRPGMDMVVEVTGTGVEQFFVLHERPTDEDAADLDLPVGVVSETGEAKELEDGGLTIVGPDEAAAVSVAVPAMWDATYDSQLASPVAQDWAPGGPGLWANEPVGELPTVEPGTARKPAKGAGRSAPVPTEVRTKGGRADLVDRKSVV